MFTESLGESAEDDGDNICGICRVCGVCGQVGGHVERTLAKGVMTEDNPAKCHR